MTRSIRRRHLIVFYVVEVIFSNFIGGELLRVNFAVIEFFNGPFFSSAINC